MKRLSLSEFAFGAALSGALWLSVAGTAEAATRATDAQLHAAWHQAIVHAPVLGQGCFTATYPSTSWKQVACKTAPNIPYLPARGPQGFTVGNGNDYAGEVSGLLSSAEGSFSKVKGLKTETNDGASNTYSLQLNSQFFASPTCAGASNPANCLGWLQFILAQQSGGDDVFMQYWLINYGSTCPAGWMRATPDCYKNSSSVGAPVQPLKKFKKLELTGSAVVGGLDTVTVTTYNNAYSTTGSDSVVGLAGFWNESEFNVIGDGGGSQADFNTGTKLIVKIDLDNGTTNTPTCESHAGTTGETNNLTLGKCTASGGATPAITFTESN
jgi:hypothetical protein